MPRQETRRRGDPRQSKDRLPAVWLVGNIYHLTCPEKEVLMLRSLSIGFVAAAMLATFSNLPAKEPEKGKPLRERFFISNAVGSTLMLLETDAVRKEIALTDAQKAKIEPLRAEMERAYDKIFRDNPDTPPPKQDGKADSAKGNGDSKNYVKNKDGSITIPVSPANPERDRKIKQETKEVERKIQKKLDGILSPDQLDRIWEIIIQAGSLIQASDLIGDLSDLNWELVKILKLSDDQVRDIEAIDREAGLAGGDIFRRGASFEELKKMSKAQRRGELHKRIRDWWPIIAQANKKLLAVLTPKQRESIAKMKGKEIDLVKLLEQITDYEADRLFEPPASNNPGR
jgi:hypothetical protein